MDGMSDFPPLALLGPPEDLEPEAPITASSSLEFLQKIYSDPCQPMSRRMRAAIAALPFESPKLAVQALEISPHGFASHLEAARARCKIIEAEPTAPLGEDGN
jgi:hypothetical protein